jgi:hypothetical protein
MGGWRNPPRLVPVDHAVEVPRAGANSLGVLTCSGSWSFRDGSMDGLRICMLRKTRLVFEREIRPMTGAAFAILYVGFCILVGLCGSQRRLGFLGTLLLSLFFTPVVVMLVLVFTTPTRSAQ